MSTTAQNIGRITQVIGSTFDAEFPEDQLPPIYNAVRITSNTKGIQIDLTGEIGHTTILMNGPLCGCGKRGCLEALASGPAIARLARESMHYGRHRRVLALAGGKPGDITAAHVVEAAKEGDAFAVQILEEAGTYLGVGIANVIQLFNPERVILGTIAVHAGDLLLEPVRCAVEEYAWERSRDVCRIVPAELGDRAQDLACVALWLDD